MANKQPMGQVHRELLKERAECHSLWPIRSAGKGKETWSGLREEITEKSCLSQLGGLTGRRNQEGRVLLENKDQSEKEQIPRISH